MIPTFHTRNPAAERTLVGRHLGKLTKERATAVLLACGADSLASLHDSKFALATKMAADERLIERAVARMRTEAPTTQSGGAIATSIAGLLESVQQTVTVALKEKRAESDEDRREYDRLCLANSEADQAMREAYAARNAAHDAFQRAESAYDAFMDALGKGPVKAREPDGGVITISILSPSDMLDTQDALDESAAKATSPGINLVTLDFFESPTLRELQRAWRDAPDFQEAAKALADAKTRVAETEAATTASYAARQQFEINRLRADIESQDDEPEVEVTTAEHNDSFPR